jgi:hypothetical protein
MIMPQILNKKGKIMSFGNLSATQLRNDSGIEYIKTQLFEKTKEENKVNGVAVNTLNQYGNQHQHLNLGDLSLKGSSVIEKIGNFKELSDKDLNILLQRLQFELQLRAQVKQSNQQEMAKIAVYRDELIKYLSSSDWVKFNSVIVGLQGNSSSLEIDAILNSLENEIVNAVSKINYFDYNVRELDAIYDTLKNSPILIRVVEIVMKKSDKQMYRLLENDQTEGNRFLVAARSKAISYFINQKNDLSRLLRGPFSFLFDDDTVVAYSGYDGDRSEFIKYLKKSTVKQFAEILYSAPKNKPLTKDAVEIFKNDANSNDKKWVLSQFLNQCPESDEKTKLLAIINAGTVS